MNAPVLKLVTVNTPLLSVIGVFTVTTAPLIVLTVIVSARASLSTPEPLLAYKLPASVVSSLVTNASLLLTGAASSAKAISNPSVAPVILNVMTVPAAIVPLICILPAAVPAVFVKLDSVLTVPICVMFCSR